MIESLANNGAVFHQNRLQFLEKSATIKPIRGIMSLSVTESGGVEKSVQISEFVAEVRIE
ncbi:MULTISPECIES: hypothetical protein [unclassified Streptococcus]|uniref:hypothetical protein n=1 Tax=unclassified Streptococcus TaxID=2608887 RepID=UPI0010718FA4|nr:MULTISPECIES: hypothetical protein [unclassified Streptococcus]MBF0787358.1 hypothetical protein [Streptococcus sp. 19428wC2_LYSM12]MCQ9211104.1 hypothetical protein [Streptococcus sp. B01]MCQ9214379.1 hypothetical protein [Streptococcus sp. O1]TFV05702.1 hypothetical protein E4T79_05565 [Streptococcus sp. LYSM12]